MAGKTITIRTEPDIVEKIAALANTMERSRNWVIEDALRQYIAAHSWQIAGIQQAQTSIEQGEGIPHSEVMAEMDALIAQAKKR